MRIINGESERTRLVLDVLRRLRPHDLTGARKVRLGRDNDGGYVMIDAFNGVEAAYSLGINDDVSWDRDMVNRGIPVIQYDHTIAQPPERHPLMTWHRLGLDRERGGNMITLADAIDQNGHTHAKNLILKCDIEGFEWQILRDPAPRLLNQFSQIVMEIHAFDHWDEPDMSERIHHSVANLCATHKVVHIHANNFASWCVVGGVPVPSVMEITMVRRDSGEFRPSEQVFPTPLDMPCDPGREDLYLGRFAY